MSIRGCSEHDNKNMVMIFSCVVSISSVVKECTLREACDLILQCPYDQIIEEHVVV